MVILCRVWWWLGGRIEGCVSVSTGRLRLVLVIIWLKLAGYAACWEASVCYRHMHCVEDSMELRL